MNNLKFLLLLSLSFFIINTAEAQSSKINLADGNYFIYVKSGNKVLDVIASSSDNNAELVAYQFTGNPNQTFRVWVDGTKSYCSFKPQHATSKRLSQSLSKKNTIVQYEAQKKSHFRFHLASRGGGYYSVKSLKNIDDKVDEVWTIVNGRLKTARYTGASNQLFKFKKAPATKTTTTPTTPKTTTTTKPTKSSHHPVSSVDALLDYTAHNDKVYFFKGDQYWRFNFKTKKVDSNYPAKISVGWKGLKNYPGKADFSKNLDAVVNRDNKHCYFFKGAYYIKWDIKNQKILPNYPAKISVGWKGLPSNFTTNIDAAYSRYDGKVYFFKGSNYIRYTVNTNKVDPGYPKETNPAFKLGNNFGNPKAAMRIHGQSAMYLWDNTGEYFKYNVSTNQKFSSFYPALISNKVWNFGASGEIKDVNFSKTTQTANQKITLKKGLYQIYVKSNNKALDVIGSSSDNNVELVAYQFTGNLNQTFRLWVDPSKSYCTLTPQHAINQRLAQSWAKKNTIIQHEGKKENHFRFQLTKRGNGYYSVKSFKNVDDNVDEVWTIMNGRLKTAKYTGVSNQLFKFEEAVLEENGFRVMLNGLHCLQSADDGNGTDEPYFEIFVDGSKQPKKTRARPMNEADRSYWEKFTDNIEAATRIAQQEFWLMPISVYAEREVRVVLWEKDDGRGDNPLVNNDDYIGEFIIKKTETNGNYKLKKFRSSEEGNWNVVYTKTTRPKYDKSLNGTSKLVNVRVPILDQGNEGACVAFATVGALTTSYLNQKKAGSSKEELFDPFKLYERRANTNTSGWNIGSCLDEILENGIPFKSNTSQRLRLKSYYEYHEDGRIIKVTYSGGRVNRSTISNADGNGYNKMRAVLKSGEPLIARYDVYPDFMAYAGIQGVYGGNIAETNSRSGGHAVFVVGYKNPSLKSHSFPTWILQNSWAPRWGKNGLCEFAEGACGFDKTMYKVGEFY